MIQLSKEYGRPFEKELYSSQETKNLLKRIKESNPKITKIKIEKNYNVIKVFEKDDMIIKEKFYSNDVIYMLEYIYRQISHDYNINDLINRKISQNK